MTSSYWLTAALSLSVLVCPDRVGAQTFVDASVGLPRTYAYGTSVADFDADGRLDFLCFDPATQWDAIIFRNREDGTFVKSATPVASNSRGFTRSVWGDDNGDGLLDLLLSGVDDT